MRCLINFKSFFWAVLFLFPSVANAIPGGTSRQGGGMIHFTQIDNFPNAVVTAGSTSVFEKFSDLGTFRKQKPNSVIKISLNSHATMTTDASFAHFCNIELRVNDSDPSGNDGDFDFRTAAGSNIRSVVHNTIIDTPFTITAIFESLPVGEHSVALFARVSAGDSCQLNPGGYRVIAVVEEIVGSVSGGN